MQDAAQPSTETHDALPQSRRSWSGKGTATISRSTRTGDPVTPAADTVAPAATTTRQMMNTQSERSRFMGPMMLRQA